jgi:hypothetical protein
MWFFMDELPGLNTLSALLLCLLERQKYVWSRHGISFTQCTTI